MSILRAAAECYKMTCCSFACRTRPNGHADDTIMSFVDYLDCVSFTRQCSTDAGLTALKTKQNIQFVLGLMLWHANLPGNNLAANGCTIIQFKLSPLNIVFHVTSPCYHQLTLTVSRSMSHDCWSTTHRFQRKAIGHQQLPPLVLSSSHCRSLSQLD